jgi:ATP/maltotriose-dependent transcriptional regulator MalT
MRNLIENNGVMKPTPINDPYHLVRQRINAMFNGAIDKPVTIVCAKTGFGKTRAVSDFLCYTNEENIMAFDDLHYSVPPEVLPYLESIANGSMTDTKIILIYREVPEVLKKSVDILKEKGLASKIGEKDLNFTEMELISFIKQQKIMQCNGMPLDALTVREIYEDTYGWSFAVNLVVRSLKRIPKYKGFAKTRLKPNIFEFIESNGWSSASENLKRFLIRLSLIKHFNAELVEALVDGEEELLSELRKQNGYINFDKDEKSYLINHFYLDFLHKKQYILKNDEKVEIYRTAADWCNQNDYVLDALAYYNKAENLCATV